MAGTSLLALIDDIANILDDVATLTKVATKKTAGVLGDDLALNAEQVTGVAPERELSVVYAVFKGSLRNKAILVPAALLISAFIPWLITPLLMLGGAFLCFEGFEKVAHRLLHPPAEDARHQAEHRAHVTDLASDVAALEKEKVQGAIRTDFILSAEIITLALGIVSEETFSTQILVLTGIAGLMTVGVYGLVAAIVKLDDLGIYLTRAGVSPSSTGYAIGQIILKTAPYLMKVLSAAGTAAMFLVGGGILSHGAEPVHALVAQLAGQGPMAGLITTLAEGAVGMIAGALLVGISLTIRRLRGARAAH